MHYRTSPNLSPKFKESVVHRTPFNLRSSVTSTIPLFLIFLKLWRNSFCHEGRQLPVMKIFFERKLYPNLKKSSIRKKKHLLHEPSINVWIYPKSVKNSIHLVHDLPIFESLLETSTLMEGLSSSGILVKVVILQLIVFEAWVVGRYGSTRSSRGKKWHQRSP